MLPEHLLSPRAISLFGSFYVKQQQEIYPNQTFSYPVFNTASTPICFCIILYLYLLISLDFSSAQKPAGWKMYLMKQLSGVCLLFPIRLAAYKNCQVANITARDFKQSAWLNSHYHTYLWTFWHTL